MFESPLCPFDLPINIYEKFAPKVVGRLERNCFLPNTYHVSCTLAHSKMRQPITQAGFHHKCCFLELNLEPSSFLYPVSTQQIL